VGRKLRRLSESYTTKVELQCLPSRDYGSEAASLSGLVSHDDWLSDLAADYTDLILLKSGR